MQPQRHHQHALQNTEESKEALGPACWDYFWLICRLVDSLPQEAIEKINLEALAQKAVQSVLDREYNETSHNTIEDDGLVGLLHLCCNVMAHNTPCKERKLGQNLLHNRVFDFLFALPNPRAIHVPKYKSQLSRSSALDLLVELVKSSTDNYKQLHEKFECVKCKCIL